MKDIKTKDKVQYVKAKDPKANMNQFMKLAYIRSKQKDIHKLTVNDSNVIPDTSSNDTNTSSQPESHAIDQIETVAHATTVDATYRAREYVKKKFSNARLKRSDKESDITDPPVSVSPSVSSERSRIISSSDRPLKTRNDHSVIHSTPAVHSSGNSFQSHHSAANPLKQSFHVSSINHQSIINNTKQVSKKVIDAVKKTFAATQSLFYYGTGLILLLVMTLFIGTFGVLANDGGTNSLIIPLSDAVLAYEETIRSYAIQYGIEEYVPLLEAIMMQESQGLGSDPMQSSECGYNTLYPQVPNGITDPVYSIDCGVHMFADCISLANVSSTADTEHIYLALQGYNYGTGYITWAIDNFGGYSQYNAQLFSDNKKQELGTSVYGDPDYVTHVMQYVGFTFRGGTEPNFDNLEAWVTLNPYAQSRLYGQCTWFAWGRFYELYGYDPGFRGDGKKCAEELVEAHPDLFELSATPATGAVFSGVGHNHVGIVISYDGTTLVIQEGNLDGITNTFEEAKTDWRTLTTTLDQLTIDMDGVVFANPK